MESEGGVNSNRSQGTLDKKNPPGSDGLRNTEIRDNPGRRRRIMAGRNLNKAGATYSLSVNQYHRSEELNYRVRNGNGCGLLALGTRKF